jgi:hypothetical protein
MKKSSSPRRAERIRELLHRASSNADPRNKTDAAKPHRLPAAPRALR